MITVEAASSVLKDYYLDVAANKLDNTNPFLAEIDKTKVDMAGKGVTKGIHVGLSGGISAGSEDGDLPVADDGNYIGLTQDLVNLYGNIRITDKVIKASRNNEGAFVDVLDDQMSFLLKSATDNLDRMLFGDGTGKLCRITGVTSGKISVDDARNIFEGMCVDIYASNGNVLHAGRKIVFVDKATKYFKVDGSAIADNGFTSGSFVTVQGSYQKEICGLGTIFNETGTIYGVDRSKSSALTPYVVKNFGEVSELKMMKVLDHLEENTGSKTNFILCSNGVRRALIEMFAQNKRFVDTMELKGGCKAISFNGIPVVADRFCPAGTMYFLNTEEFCMYQLGDWEWVTGDDGKVLKQVPGKPIYEATLAKYVNLMCFNPAGQAMVTGVTEAD